MDWQVLRLQKCLAESDPWASLTFQFPEVQTMADELSIAGLGTKADVEPSVMRVLRQYASDWRGFSALQLLERSRTETV